MTDAVGNLYVGEDNAIWWEGLYDRVAMIQAGRTSPAAADYVNDAAITWVIRAAAADGSFDPAGALVTNGGGTMSYVTGSNGTYVGTIEDDAALTTGATYWIVVTLSASGDKVGSRKIKYVAGLHGSTP